MDQYEEQAHELSMRYYGLARREQLERDCAAVCWACDLLRDNPDCPTVRPAQFDGEFWVHPMKQSICDCEARILRTRAAVRARAAAPEGDQP